MHVVQFLGTLNIGFILVTVKKYSEGEIGKITTETVIDTIESTN